MEDERDIRTEAEDVEGHKAMGPEAVEPDVEGHKAMGPEALEPDVEGHSLSLGPEAMGPEAMGPEAV